MTLREYEERLRRAGIWSARSDVTALASHVLGMSNASVMARYGDEITGDAAASLEAAVSRREAREPLQYIIGKWEFYGDEYVVSPSCLIPRPETEMLAEYGISRLSSGDRVADLCCGSGCIGIALCRHAGVICDAVDVSADALDVARLNAERLGAAEMISFQNADVTVGGGPSGKYKMIFANPPYIKSGVMDALEPELSYEPALALDGGDDGMRFYRSIMDNYGDNLDADGEFVFEIGYDEGAAIADEADARGYYAVVYNDFSSLPRMAVVKRKTREQ